MNDNIPNTYDFDESINRMFTYYNFHDVNLICLIKIVILLVHAEAAEAETSTSRVRGLAGVRNPEERVRTLLGKGQMGSALMGSLQVS